MVQASKCIFLIWNLGRSSRFGIPPRADRVKCGIGNVPQKQKVIGLVGERPFQTVSGEKPVNTTLLTYVSAGGLHVPPMVIFKASRVKPEWREYAPSGYAVRASESGYISTKLFADYGEKFVKFLRESNLMTPGIKHVVLLDLHKSHLFNSSYMEYMQANNIEVCSFPPHCTHILQPLDDLPYAMLKRKFQKELISFNLQVAGEKLSKQQFFRVLIPAFSGAFQPEIIRKGFKNTGIYPLNQDAPKLKQLGPSQVYDKCKSNAVNCSFRHFRYWLPNWLLCWFCTNLFLFSSTCSKRVIGSFCMASGSHNFNLIFHCCYRWRRCKTTSGRWWDPPASHRKAGSRSCSWGSCNYAWNIRRRRWPAWYCCSKWGCIDGKRSHGCGKPMQMKKSNDSKDTYVWRCRKVHKIFGPKSTYTVKDVKLSIRHQSWLVDAKLSLELILELIYLWSQGFSQGEIIHELKLSNKTVTEWTNFFQESCIWADKQQCTYRGKWSWSWNRREQIWKKEIP